MATPEELVAECVEAACGHATFRVTVKEQQYYTGLGFAIPKRCKACRQRRKAAASTYCTERASNEMPRQTPQSRPGKIDWSK